MYGHFAAVKRERDETQARHRSVVAGLQKQQEQLTAQKDAEIARLAAEVDWVARGNRSADSDARIESEAVERAEGQRDSAYRSRDYSNAALWLVLDVHHVDDGDVLCSCGLRSKDCATWVAVEDVAPNIWRWEREQVDRLRAERPHGLPDAHPEVVSTGRDSHWVWTNFGRRRE